MAPSAIAVEGEAHTPEGKLPYPVPHALTTAEVEQTRDAFVAAARRAVDAGFDGVELHGAIGYLLHEFLAPGSNVREDRYGGSPEIRIRFVVEVATDVAAEVGASRVGLRISPAHGVQGVVEDDQADVATTYGLLADALRPLGLAYLSVLHSDPTSELVQDIRTRFGGHLMINDGFGVVTTRDDAEALVAEGLADSWPSAGWSSRTPTSSSAGGAGTRRTSPTRAPSTPTGRRATRLPVPLGRLSLSRCG